MKRVLPSRPQQWLAAGLCLALTIGSLVYAALTLTDSQQANHNLIVRVHRQQKRIDRQQRRITALVLSVRALALQDHRVQCAESVALNRQVVQGNKFLRQHPNGVDGFTPGLIRSSIASTKQQLAPYASLTCRKGVNP